MFEFVFGQAFIVTEDLSYQNNLQPGERDTQGDPTIRYASGVHYPCAWTGEGIRTSDSDFPRLLLNWRGNQEWYDLSEIVPVEVFHVHDDEVRAQDENTDTVYLTPQWPCWLAPTGEFRETIPGNQTSNQIETHRKSRLASYWFHVGYDSILEGRTVDNLPVRKPNRDALQRGTEQALAFLAKQLQKSIAIGDESTGAMP